MAESLQGEVTSFVNLAHTLHNVVGDTEIRKGKGMELDQAFRNISYLQKRNANIHPLNLDELRNAFLMRETSPVYLSVAEKGISTAVVKSNRDFRDKERKHKKNQDDENKKYKGGKKHKHRHKGQE
ncbi:hypothetical protein CIPAW_09G118000 [Carya illinoinensis]|uniref:Uncharacterized protein n=1 Tax=Carya illinoinensis TaxID=32201 RepID=A0A8T1PNZ6_CARIL|nr:hypothetical protein CIPAW_09G118000 [Carya illinoinensis]KAG6642070.1 hypothetical protein CIPAW_09G118000 [Carya illinoinensis]KAG6642072.1 hypothetical protein CIPAW_09G118000 [Carya illinoinensis]KAG6642073.1 hypothetical protein CIPAW_09G118000 [Carya illinoinensis]